MYMVLLTDCLTNRKDSFNNHFLFFCNCCLSLLMFITYTSYCIFYRASSLDDPFVAATHHHHRSKVWDQLSLLCNDSSENIYTYDASRNSDNFHDNFSTHVKTLVFIF